jgi:hypothetical protein
MEFKCNEQLRRCTVTTKNHNFFNQEFCFHGFFQVCDSDNEAYPIALIEDYDGEIHHMAAHNIKFIERF